MSKKWIIFLLLLFKFVYIYVNLLLNFFKLFFLIFLDDKMTKKVTFVFTNMEKNEVSSTKNIISVVRGRDWYSQQ